MATGKILYKGRSEDGVYPIYPHKATALLSNKVCNSVKFSSSTWSLWHSRLGHPNAHTLRLLLQNNGLPCNSSTVVNSCIHCLHGKMHRLPFPSSRFVANSPFELVHSDLWGPAPLDSINGYKYYVIFVDHYTRFTWLYLLTNKSEVYSKFVLFHAMVKTQFSTTIKTLRSDGGGEYTSKSFESFLTSNGIHHQISCPYSPQQNGLVERKHRHLIETVITLLSQASLPSTYWSFAVQSALSLINLLPTLTLGFLSPWFKLYGQHPDITSFKIFGCACYPFLRPYTKHKLEHRTTECLFLGYSTMSKGYLCLDLLTNKLYTCRHVLFNEAKFPFTSTISFVSIPNPPTSKTWLSNLLYLHSSN